MRRLARLPLFLRAFCTVAAMRLGLWMLPFQWLRSWAGRVNPRANDVRVESLLWSVRAAARRVPMASCLTQALALQRMLGRSGRASVLEIGVKKETGAFAAHAWLTYQDEVLIGGGESDRYSPLVAWKTGTP